MIFTVSELFKPEFSVTEKIKAARARVESEVKNGKYKRYTCVYFR